MKPLMIDYSIGLFTYSWITFEPVLMLNLQLFEVISFSLSNVCKALIMWSTGVELKKVTQKDTIYNNKIFLFFFYLSMSTKTEAIKEVSWRFFLNV